MTAEASGQEKDKVLVVFAHPDDAEFTSGGTIAKWTAAGAEIHYAVCTDGSKGSEDTKISTQELMARREEEQLAAARMLGVREVHFLRHADGELVADQGLKAELVKLIRRLQPSIILAWDPWRHYQLHTDHREAGRTALDAVMAAGNPRFFPEQVQEGLPPHRVDEVWLFGTDEPDHWEDISQTFATKMEAIAQHRSQVADQAAIEAQVGSWNASLAERLGVAYAEAFKVLRPHCEICR